MARIREVSDVKRQLVLVKGPEADSAERRFADEQRSGALEIRDRLADHDFQPSNGPNENECAVGRLSALLAVGRLTVFFKSMHSAPKHAAPQPQSSRRGGRHRRRQPFRPSFALKTLGAIMFVMVGSLSTVAASAPPATSPSTTTTCYESDHHHLHQFDHFDDHEFDHFDDHEFDHFDDHHYDAISRPHSHHVWSGGCTTRPPTPPSSCMLAASGSAIRRRSLGLPSGAVFTATEVGGTGATFTCTTSGTTGTCSIGVPPDGHAVGCDRDHSTARLLLESDDRLRDEFISQFLPLHIPHRSVERHHDRRCTWRHPEWSFHLATDPVRHGQVFSGLLSTSLDNPAGVALCGLNIALVLDQSGSMAQNGKQAALFLRPTRRSPT